MTATFGGEAIFGTAIKVRSEDAPRAFQMNEYGGLDGVECLDRGDRGGKTVVTGLLTGDSAAALGANLDTLRSYRDGVPRDLVDSLGSTYANVLMESFRATSSVGQSPAGACFVTYEATFVRLTAN